MYWVWGTRSLGMGHRRPELRASMGTAVNPLGEYFVILLMIVVIVGAVAREPLIAALGALAFVIAVSSRIWAALSLEEITVDRSASIDHAFQGDEIEITFTVENKKPLPVPWIEINEFVPRGLLVEGHKFIEQDILGGADIKFSTSLGAYERVRIKRKIRALSRGTYRLGKTHLRSGDLFGLYPAEATLEPFTQIGRATIRVRLKQHDEAALRAFIVDLPGDCVLIHDEAYIDFAPPEAVIEMDTTDRRVLRMRTFSKAHGMAGARVGYVVAHAALIGSLDKIRNHFGVNRVAQAGALASLGDESFIRQVVEQVAAGRRDYEVIAAETGLMTVPSATNFVCIDVGDGERARRVQQALLDRDIFVRMPAIAPQDRCIRATVGTPEQRTIFARVFRDVVAAT